MNWLKDKIIKRIKATNCKSFTIKRDYNKNIVTIDYFGGGCVKYTYNGKWVCG